MATKTHRTIDTARTLHRLPVRLPEGTDTLIMSDGERLHLDEEEGTWRWDEHTLGWQLASGLTLFAESVGARGTTPDGAPVDFV